MHVAHEALSLIARNDEKRYYMFVLEKLIPVIFDDDPSGMFYLTPEVILYGTLAGVVTQALAAKNYWSMAFPFSTIIKIFGDNIFYGYLRYRHLLSLTKLFRSNEQLKRILSKYYQEPSIKGLEPYLAREVVEEAWVSAAHKMLLKEFNIHPRIPIREFVSILYYIEYQVEHQDKSTEIVIETLKNIGSVDIPCIVITNDYVISHSLYRWYDPITFFELDEIEECRSSRKCVGKVGNLEVFMIRGRDPLETCRLVLESVPEIVEWLESKYSDRKTLLVPITDYCGREEGEEHGKEGGVTIASLLKELRSRGDQHGAE